MNKPMPEKYDIAIVGCGAATVSFLKSLLIQFQKIPFYENHPISIIIFEKSNTLGSGSVYQRDLKNLLINRPLGGMSVNIEDYLEFEKWLLEKGEYESEIIVEANKLGDNRSYTARTIFGYYLNYILFDTIEKLKNNFVTVKFVNCEVTDINSRNPFKIETQNNSLYLADYLILCTGNNNPQDIYQLGQTPSYINNPYPVEESLKSLNKDYNIGIIGNSLTAIDIAISLKNLGHKGIIGMMSRKYTNPRVRGEITRYPLQYLTVKNIETIKAKKGIFSILDALRLFRKEMQKISYDWRFIFRENSKEISASELLQNEILSSLKKRQWQSLLASTNEIIEYLWNAIDAGSKSVFIDKYHRIWLCNRSPIPITNAYQLLSLYDKQLYVFHGLERIVFCKAENKYIVYFKDLEFKVFDTVINATGPSNKISMTTNKLLYSLVCNGLLKENIFGGIEVDFDSSSAISKNGLIDHNIKVVGHNTIGTYYYTSSLEMIVKNSAKIAKNLFTSINKKNE
jgi:uncharacterized NAD(P)/FAD-binding protein YdhS